MIRILIALAFAALVVSQDPEIVPGQFIVVLKSGSTRSSLRKLISDYDEDQKVISSFKNILGYAAKFDDEVKEKLQNDSRVAYVEPVQMYRTTQFTCSLSHSTTEYFLPRISSRSTSPPQTYRHSSTTVAGLTAYVLDTGLNINHQEFSGGRATLGPSFIAGQTAVDGHGHGTCCAGILGGNALGAAKFVKIVGVKVLSNSGTGSNIGIINAINWVLSQAGRKIISMSLGGGFSQALNDAVTNAVNRGVPVFVAAGNEYIDARLKSPASTPLALTIAASDINNRFAYFSNWGPIVDLIAPGVNIKCASAFSNTGFTFMSGTSMACPLAAGAGALMLSKVAYTPAQLTSNMIAQANLNRITGVPAGTPNRLLYNGCL